MFLRKLKIERIDEHGEPHPCPIKQLDSFAMRNFTNDAIFDDPGRAGSRGRARGRRGRADHAGPVGATPA